MKRWIDYIILLLYFVCMHTLWKLCQLGGIGYYLKILLPCAVLLAIFIIVKLILRHNGFRASFFKIRFAAFLIITVVFSGLILYSAIPYHGQLSWAIDEWLNHKRIEFTHNNIYENGIDGILSDIDVKLDMPEELYVSNSFSVAFDADGTVKSIDTLLYGKDSSEKIKTFLISYDSSRQREMDVWVRGEANSDFDPDMLLSPLLQISDKADYKNRVMSWAKTSDESTYGILYYGKRSFYTAEGLVFVEGDADGDGISGTADAIYRITNGGEISGYEVSLYVPGDESITPVRYIMEPEYRSQESINQEHAAEISEEAKNTARWTTDDTNGSLYTFVPEDKTIGFRLVVTDAAAGSRYYELEKTVNGGNSWETLNSNPFMNVIGVAEGIEFFDSNFGFIGLQGASGEHSQIYKTTDGGVSFQEIQLPMDQVTEVPEPGKTYGLTIADYQYLYMPVKDGDRLSITVTSSSAETGGILFYSEDNGENWHLGN